MRFINGLIVGVILTIGMAYIVDSMHTAPGADNKPAPQMVNWTVVTDNLRGLSTDVQAGWDRLVGKAKEVDKRTGV